MNISVLGAGSWGTALATLLVANAHTVKLWSYKQSQVDSLNSTRVNDKLPGVKLPEELIFTSDIIDAVESAELIVMAVPSTATRETAELIKPYYTSDKIIVCVTKGIEEDTLLTQTKIVEQVLGTCKTAVLSGPSHAEEVVLLQPTLVVVGSEIREVAETVQSIFMNNMFRVYTNSDVIGIELGGSLKNVIALAAGMLAGVGYGDNAVAALITRGISEINRLAVALGGKTDTLAGLAGVGDLIVTCASQHSRNRMAGFYIGQGLTMEQAMHKVNMTVEGVYSAKAALALATTHKVDMPITEVVNKVLFDGLDVHSAVIELMTRDKKSETSGDTWN